MSKATDIHEFLFERLRYHSDSIDDTELLAGFADIQTADLAAKADKVSGATAGHFASLVLDVATGKFNIADSTFDQNSFAAVAHNHNTSYIRKNLSDTYDATQYVLTFKNDATHTPFVIFDSTLVIENLNAGLLGSYKASQFSLTAHNHDLRYLRNDTSTSFVSTGGNTFTFTNDLTHAPFAVADKTVVVTNLNAEYLNGLPNTYFSAASHNHDTRYLKLNNDNSYDSTTYTFIFANDLTHAPFSVTDKSVVVTNLNAEYLNGHADTYFSAASHDHDSRYYTESEVDTLLLGKLPVITQGGASSLKVVIMKADGKELYESAYALDDLATAAQLAAKADEVTGATANNFAKLILNIATGKYTIADSGKSDSDYADASHTHDDRYFTETELTDGSTSLALSDLSVAGSLTLTDTQAAAGEAGSLNNVQTAGDPGIFLKINIAGADYAFPGWAIP